MTCFFRFALAIDFRNCREDWKITPLDGGQLKTAEFFRYGVRYVVIDKSKTEKLRENEKAKS